MSKAWIIKYAPESLDRVIGQDSGVSQVRDFVVNFKNQKKKAIIVHGPTGCGKTASIYALCDELGYELLEINASDVRNKGAIETIIGTAVNQQSLFHKGKVILFWKYKFRFFNLILH